MDTEKQKELWDHLENESERAYRAFESYLTLPGVDRTLLAAYRNHVGNPDAVKPSDTWSKWSSDFAWRERAAAYDDHLTTLRREAYERTVQEEAKRQATIDERHRNHMNELMTLGYNKSMQWLEEVGSSGMRSSDVFQVIRLHIDAVKTFSIAEEPKEDEWTEEDDAFIDEVVKDIEAENRPDQELDDADDSPDGDFC